MYLRMVQAKVKPESVQQLRRFYEEKIIPMLSQMEGCVHASLLQSTARAEDCFSLSLWQQRQHADAYEKSGVFSKLLEQASQFFETSSDWNLHLTNDLTLQYDPVPERPTVTVFHLPTNHAATIFPRDRSTHVYIRIVTPQIRQGKMQEFKKIFTEDVLPKLRSAKGCLHAFLIQNVKHAEQVVSLTIWSDRQAADEYERSGLFATLTENLEHCFSEMYQWKRQLERESRSLIVTSEDLSVEGYHVLTGKSFL